MLIQPTGPQCSKDKLTLHFNDSYSPTLGREWKAGGSITAPINTQLKYMYMSAPIYHVHSREAIVRILVLECIKELTSRLRRPS